MTYDIIVPTFKEFEDVAALVFNLRAAQPMARIIATCSPGSPSVNRNVGLAESGKDIVVMVDDDIRDVPAGFADRLVDAIEADENIVMSSALLRDKHGNWGAMLGGGIYLDSGVTDATEKRLCTACCAIRVNGQRFCEQLTAWEDTYWCAEQLERNPNARFVVVHDVRVTHLNEEKWRKGDAWERNKAIFEERFVRRPPIEQLIDIARKRDSALLERMAIEKD
jgi:glycosyltransferase involved in cell wall biosynthesis